MRKEQSMNYRQEWKHEISYEDMLILRRRLSAVMKRDSHTIGDTYLIRSLYFDNAEDKVLREKLDGVNHREKFRIRYYNHDSSVIHLEKKSKVNGLCLKESTAMSKEQAELIVSGKYDWMAASGIPLIEELYRQMMWQGLRPRTIVDYTREPFIFAPGNVRVTIDYDIRTGLRCTDFLNADCITIPAGDAGIILEVKWDGYLPDIIRDIVQLPNCRSGAFSKYAACRIYG